MASLWGMLGFKKKAPPSPAQSHIDAVREAAFAVIEASLEAEPEKWGVIGETHALWLWNKSNAVAVYTAVAPMHLHVLVGAMLVKTTVGDLPTGGQRLDPTPRMKINLFNAAMKIAKPHFERKEEERLRQMVERFSQEDKENDQAAA